MNSSFGDHASTELLVKAGASTVAKDRCNPLPPSTSNPIRKGRTPVDLVPPSMKEGSSTKPGQAHEMKDTTRRALLAVLRKKLSVS